MVKDTPAMAAMPLYIRFYIFQPIIILFGGFTCPQTRLVMPGRVLRRRFAYGKNEIKVIGNVP
jgi:hypothetical protein